MATTASQVKRDEEVRAICLVRHIRGTVNHVCSGDGKELPEKARPSSDLMKGFYERMHEVVNRTLRVN
jgi:hypothetical protein